MIVIDQLRISDDGTKMFVNAHVNKAKYFDDITIENITIMTGDKVSESTPNQPTSDYVYKEEFEDETKEINLVLTVNDFTKTWKTDPQAMIFKQGDMCNSLFFVYIKCKGTPGECTPCTLDEDVTLAVTFWGNMLYRKVMGYTKELTEACSIPTAFTDFILLWNAFKASVETEHWDSAIKFFNLLFEDSASMGYTNVRRGCGCHG